MSTHDDVTHHVQDEHHDHDEHGPAKGLWRWVVTTNHKDIGTLYLWFSLIMFFVGGAMALIITCRFVSAGNSDRRPHVLQFDDHDARHCDDLRCCSCRRLSAWPTG